MTTGSTPRATRLSSAARITASTGSARAAGPSARWKRRALVSRTISATCLVQALSPTPCRLLAEDCALLLDVRQAVGPEDAKSVGNGREAHAFDNDPPVFAAEF